jgi:hypothetical protein
MAEYLRLVSEGRVNVNALISAIYPLEDAPRAYADLQQPGAKPLIALLSYLQAKPDFSRRVDVALHTGKPHTGKIRMVVVGAGAVVTKDVLDYALMVGNPAKQIGWMCKCGEKLNSKSICPACDKQYVPNAHGLSKSEK